MKKYKPKEFTEMLNVSVKTLQRWDNEGVWKAYRNPKERKYYTEEQYREYMGIPKENPVGKTVIYARVSTKNQKDDLENQVEFLRQYANAKGMMVDEVVTDIGSGLNDKRKHWNRLMEECVDGKVSIILIAHKDRFVRFGEEWFEQFLNTFRTKMIVVNNEKLSPQEELVQDLISIIDVFSCRVYGLRKYIDKIKEDE